VVVKVLEVMSKSHSKWVRVAKSFGLKEEAEDLVQDMYLKIYDWKGKYNKTLMFNESEVNHYFVFLVLRNLYLDKCKKQKKMVRVEEKYSITTTLFNDLEYKQELEIIKDEINSWHLYDRKIYELIYKEGYSMLELSKKTGIDYYSIYRTKNKIDKLLHKKLKK
jgi:RNA polymerase sigma factor (sigma-70 family)